MKNLEKICALYLLVSSAPLFSQQLHPEFIGASGGTISNSNTSLYWNIGETVTAHFQSSNNQLTSGFVQPTYIISPVLSDKQDRLVNMDLFPNPVNDQISFKFNGQPGRLRYVVLNTMGAVLKKGEIQNESSSISCADLAPSTYLLKIMDISDTFLQSFKIIKL